MSRQILGRRTVMPLAALAAAALTISNAGARDLEQRVERIEQLLDSQALGQLSNRQERLREQVSELSGDIDSLRNELESLRERQRNLFQDLDDRLLALEEARENDEGSDDDGGGDANGGDGDDADREPTTGDGRPPEAEEAPGGDDGTDGEAAGVYQEAFDLLRDGDYRAAADGFRNVIEDHPDSDYTDNARYWLGETYYVEREFDEAMEHFGALLDQPESNKHPDALLKAGYIHYEREEWDRARELLERVRDEYPDDSVAELAADRLERMNDNNR